MDRNQFEDRIRASLQERADDVQPTPALWEQVADRTTRQSRRLWAGRLAKAAGGLAVGAVAAFGVVQLTSSPQTVTIDPANPASPDPADPQPTDPASDTGDSMKPAPDDSPRVVTTDGARLMQVDPITGETFRDLNAFDGFQEPPVIGDVAVRPLAGDGRLTVATTIALEGLSWEVQVTTWDPDGRIESSYRVPQVIADVSPETMAQPPTLTWSQDGTFLAYTVRERSGETMLTLFDWEDQWVGGTQRAVSFIVPPEFGGPQDVASWTGAPLKGPSTLTLVGPDGLTRVRVDAPDPNACALPGEDCSREPRLIGFEPFVFEGGAPMDAGVLGNGVEVVLVARAGGGQDAEGATLAFVADPMSDTQRTLDLPELTDGTASPSDAWMTVQGEWVTAGFGGRAFLARIIGDTVEDLTVAIVVELPAGTSGAAAR